MCIASIVTVFINMALFYIISYWWVCPGPTQLWICTY